MKNKNNRPWRVIIDTNIWISFLIGKHLAGLHRHINSGQVKIVTCKKQLQELVDVLNRPRIRKYISESQAEEFLDLLCEVAFIVEPKQGAAICRDPKDDYLLYTAITAKANYLVSGDNDLLILDHIGNTQIISYTNFDILLKSVEDVQNNASSTGSNRE